VKANRICNSFEIWKNFPEFLSSLEKVIEIVKDYCLNKTMYEVKNTPLLSKEEGLAYYFIEKTLDR